MTDLVNTLSAFPPDGGTAHLGIAEYDRLIRKFWNTLNQISVNTYVKGTEASQLLDFLDPSHNTLAYLSALIANIRVQGESAARPKSVNIVPDTWRPRGSHWNKAVHFLGTFDPVQVRYTGTEWRFLVEYIARVASVLGQPATALIPMRTAILRLDPSGSTFTSTHLVFIRLCMESGAYAQAVPLLDCHIHGFPSTPTPGTEAGLPCAKHILSSGYITTRSGLTNKIVTSNVQEYFLLGAMAFLGLEKYSDAQILLEHVLVTPTVNIANGLMLEAYKKWLLAGALVHGFRKNPPQTCNHTAIKLIRAASKAYEHLVDVFQGGSLPRLLAEIDVALKIWDDDGNLGLVQKLVENHTRFALYKLQRIYASIPFTTLSTMLGRDEAELESYIQDLIAGGHVNASIDASTAAGGPKVLHFFSDQSQGPMAKSEKQLFEELGVHAATTDALTEQVKAADHRLNLTKEYLEAERRKKTKAQNAMPGEEAMDTSWDSAKDGIDEDMMADM